MSATKVALALVAMTLTVANAEAGGCSSKVHPIGTIQPISPPIGAPPVVHQNQWTFGLTAVRSHTLNGQPALLVTSVSPYGAAARAGLEPGDLIVRSNGLGFNHGPTHNHSLLLADINILQHSVRPLGGGIGGGIPTATATFASTQVNVAPVAPALQGMTQLEVQDVRTHNRVLLNVYPAHNGFGGGGGIPTAAAATFK